MFCKHLNHNEISYNMVQFIRDNEKHIGEEPHNQDLAKEMIESLVSEDITKQLNAQLVFLRAFPFLFNKAKETDELWTVVEAHNIFGVQVSSFAAQDQLGDDVKLNEGAIKTEDTPINSQLFIFQGLPLFMKNGKAYNLDGTVQHEDISTVRDMEGSVFYIIGNVYGESYDLTD